MLQTAQGRCKRLHHDNQIVEACQSETPGDRGDHHGKNDKNHQKCAHTGNRHRRPALISAFLPEQFYTAQLLLAGIHGGIQNIGEHKSPEERLQKHFRLGKKSIAGALRRPHFVL